MSLLPIGSTVTPKAAHLVAVLVECNSVWLARHPLKAVCGLDLAAANPYLVPCRKETLEVNLYELPWRPLSRPATVLHIPLCTDEGASEWEGFCNLNAVAHGTCH